MNNTLPTLVDSASVRPHVLECLRRLLSDDVPAMDDVLNPIDDLGLESVDGINFIVLLGKAMHHEFPHEFNPFFDSTGRSRSIGRIVSSVCRKMQSETCKTATQLVQS